jgi:hypothetical protein
VTHGRISRLGALLVLAFICGTGAILHRPAAARASGTQVTIAGDPRVISDPEYYLSRFRALGATTARVFLFWDSVTPAPRAKRMPADFDPTDPNSYRTSGWSIYDQIVQDAQSLGMSVDFTLTGGPPRWAEGSGIPPQGGNPYFAWKPNARLYGDFVRAVARRYDGSFTPAGASTPLPAVHWWTLWNEPNFGEDLGPQAIDGSTVPSAPAMYRQLLNAGWTALHQTGHGGDKIIIGGFAAEGLVHRPSHKHPVGLPGDYGQTKPLKFIRYLYCVDDSYRPMAGRFASVRGCPSNASGWRRFRAQNPALFAATGVGIHPYSGGLPPVAPGRHIDHNYAEFFQLGNLEHVLDRVNRVYGSGRHFALYNDEYGYITHPPQTAKWASPSTAAYYLNWSEYISWRNPRMASYAQYLLSDPPPGVNAGFASGLFTDHNQPKATYYAFRLPVYMPNRAPRRGQATEVWGNVRPAHFMTLDTGQPQTVRIQIEPHDRGPFQTIRTVTISNPRGYFDVRVPFSVSGHVRLAYTYPTGDDLLTGGLGGQQITSRLVQIEVR